MLPRKVEWTVTGIGGIVIEVLTAMAVGETVIEVGNTVNAGANVIVIMKCAASGTVSVIW